MHRSLRNLLLLATTGALFPASFAWSRDLPNVDALANAVPRPQTKIAQKTPTSVQRIVRDEQLGVASFVWFDPATRAAAPVSAVKRVASDPVAAARAEFKAVASLYGVTEAELDASPAQLHSSPSSATKLVRFTGQRDGVPVFREQATVLLNAQSQALNIGGYLGSTKLAPLVKSATATRLSPAMAAQIALQDFEFGKDIAARFYVPESRRKDDASGYRWIDLPNEVTGADGAALEQPIRYRPVWFRLPQGLVSAIYLEVRVFEAGEHHAYSYVVASDGGQLLFRNQQSSHQAAPQSPSSATFSYGVWADPQTGVPYPGPQGLDLSPYPNAGPDGYSARLIGPSRLTLASVPFSKSDSWVDSGVNSQRIYFTYGNNVRAWADAASPNGYDGMAVGDISACKGGQQAADMDFYACTTDAAFDYNYDFSSGPLKNQAQASASVVNMFYTLNWLHDWFYNAGFDEASGNAQASNFGRGGVESDPIDARALVSGVRNNASMDAPADGASPILRGYIYDYGGGPCP